AKTAIAKCFARIQRLREQGFFLMKRFRPAEEILSFDEDLPWREAEVLAGRQLEMAEKVLQAGAVPAETDGRHSEAVTAAGQAAAAITAAESAVQAATDVYRAEREAVHLGNVSNIKGVADLLEPDIAELGRLSKAARRAFAERDWASVRKAIGRHARYTRGIRARLEAIAAQAGEALIGGVGRLDEFPEDRFGWLNARELMGNDPVNWPCCVWPSDSEWIDLAGKWDFRIDPNNVGEKQKWPSGHGEQWGQLVVPRAWERQGITADNRKAPNAPIGGRAGRETTGRDKPYNGFAWYRKRVLVPRTWKGKPLRLRLGRVENWCRVFLNGQAIGTLERAGEGRRLGPADVVTIPPAAVDFGRENLLCLQVYNHDNFGGIVSGPVALHVDDARPSFRETPGPLSFAQEYTWKTPRGPVRQTLFIGAMSPGVVMVREDDLLELRGWRAKGTGSADALVFETGANLRVVRLDKPRRIDPAAVTGGWFSVAGRSVRVVIVPGRRPKSVTWQANVPGGGILRFQFDRPAVRVAIVSLPPEVEMRKGHYDFWVSALASYPVSASQCVWMAKGINGSQTPRPATRPAAPMRQYVTEYEYLKLGNAPELQTWKFAPLPMLLSFALSHGMTVRVPPGAVRSTGYSWQYCRYLMARDDGTFYDYPAPDRSKMMKGVGELFARSDAARNVHGGLGEREMFRRMSKWGFDHCRYALAFD
ncbi:MAG: sugar-binding domain-containing protein, partial [Phycisphaerae bacterium]